MSAPGGVTLRSCEDIGAVSYTVTTIRGAAYYYVVVEEAGLALVQRLGRHGWAEVSLADLVLEDASGLKLVTAAIEDAFVP